jgi:hypothetical protein
MDAIFAPHGRSHKFSHYLLKSMLSSVRGVARSSSLRSSALRSFSGSSKSQGALLCQITTGHIEPCSIPFLACSNHDRA